jgi:acyl dehydratase
VDEPVLYFEDIEVGAVYRTSARTITESDIVSFAGLSGDYHPLHVDELYARESPFGARIAHGLLVLSISSGLSCGLEMARRLQPSLLGMMEVSARFLGPVRIGDTICVEHEVRQKRLTSAGDRGIFVDARQTLNQRGEPVIESEWVAMVALRPVP